MRTVQSGKQAYLVDPETLITIPILSWSYSQHRNRPKFHPSSNTLFAFKKPISLNGTIAETLTIKGIGDDLFRLREGGSNTLNIEGLASDISDMIDQSTFDPFPISHFFLGIANYPEFDEIVDYQLEFRGTPISFQINQSYDPINTYDFIWALTYMGVISTKNFTRIPEEIIPPYQDISICPRNPCALRWYTYDTYFGDPIPTEGNAIHNMNIFSYELRKNIQQIVTSDSNKRPFPISGVFNETLNLQVQGDFNYWLDQINGVNAQYYVLRRSDNSVPLVNTVMKVDDVSDLRANVQTGEVISASIKLSTSWF